MTRRLFSELQVRVDGVNAMPRLHEAVDAAVRASTRRVRERRQFRDGVRATQVQSEFRARARADHQGGEILG